MKKIDELTEQEILNLSSEDIDKMIKFRMAEEGIKFIEYPAKPEFFEVPKPTTKAYYCHLLGQKISFTSIDELNSLLEVLNNCKSICSIESNYDLPEGYKYYMKAKVENASYSSEAPDTITPLTTYTHKEYCEIKEQLKENTKNKNDFQSKLKEYEAAINDAKWIEDEIKGRVSEVNEKYWKLESFCRKFKFDYMPLSSENETIAMNFMDKAYSLTDEQKEYVLENYKSI